jgi:hypothetical protein
MSPLVSLLERLGVEPSLAGDLIEEYSSERSLIWLLWQGLAAAVLASARVIRHHKVLAIRAIVTGLILLSVISRLAYFPLLTAIDQILAQHGFVGGQLQFFFEPYIAPMLLLLATLAAGWITGRLHRPHSVLLVAGLWFAVVLIATRSSGYLWTL